MSSEQPRRARESGGSGGSPIGSTAAIIIAVIAVVGGFLILRQINDDDDGSADTTLPGITTGSTGAPGDTSGTATTLDPGATGVTPTLAPETTLSATPTTPPAVTTGATVIVANASTVDGAAGRFTTALKGVQFTTADATNATVKLPVSVIYYVEGDAAAQPVAAYLASLLGGISVEPMPAPPPVNGGALPAGVTVLLMLGSDKADKTLAEAGAPATTTIPAAGTTVAPTTPTT